MERLCRQDTGLFPRPSEIRVFHMYGALAEFERSLIRERTQAGLAAARRAGRTGGRPPKLTDDDIEAAKALLANPDIGVTQIAHRLGVSPATLSRYIRATHAPRVHFKCHDFDHVKLRDWVLHRLDSFRLTAFY